MPLVKVALGTAAAPSSLHLHEMDKRGWQGEEGGKPTAKMAEHRVPDRESIMKPVTQNTVCTRKKKKKKKVSKRKAHLLTLEKLHNALSPWNVDTL